MYKSLSNETIAACFFLLHASLSETPTFFQAHSRRAIRSVTCAFRRRRRRRRKSLHSAAARPVETLSSLSLDSSPSASCLSRQVTTRICSCDNELFTPPGVIVLVTPNNQAREMQITGGVFLGIGILMLIACGLLQKKNWVSFCCRLVEVMPQLTRPTI